MSRSGDWMCTFGGVKWFTTDPHPDDVRIEDIAHALSLICRYGGHTREFYSVAQHSLLVAKAAADAYPGDDVLLIHALLHDAAEAYLGDMVRPLKSTQPQYKALEKATEVVIAEALRLPPISAEQRALIKHYDDVALMTERRDLINHRGIEWTPRALPLAEVIRPMIPSLAEWHFLNCYGAVIERLGKAA